MPLSQELKQVLACPQCKGELVFREEASEIDCEACGLTFPIEDGTPVLVLEEAQRRHG